MRVEVRIINPVLGGQAGTSLKRAERFVRKGKAIFVDPRTIRFLDSPQQADIGRRAEIVLHARITNAAYDGVSATFFDCARAIPVLNPRALVAPRGKRKEAR